jgi:hypothetical protein
MDIVEVEVVRCAEKRTEAWWYSPEAVDAITLTVQEPVLLLGFLQPRVSNWKGAQAVTLTLAVH